MLVPQFGRSEKPVEGHGLPVRQSRSRHVGVNVTAYRIDPDRATAIREVQLPKEQAAASARYADDTDEALYDF